MIRTGLISVCLLAIAAGGALASTDVNGGRVIFGTLDASAAAAVFPCPVGTSTPGTCSVGQCFYDSDATTTFLYLCTATNVWTGIGIPSTSLVPLNPAYAQEIDSGCTGTPVGRNLVLRTHNADCSGSSTATLGGGVSTNNLTLSSGGGFTAGSSSTSSMVALGLTGTLTTSVGTLTSSVAAGGTAWLFNTTNTINSSGTLAAWYNNGTRKVFFHNNGDLMCHTTRGCQIGSLSAPVSYVYTPGLSNGDNTLELVWGTNAVGSEVQRLDFTSHVNTSTATFYDTNVVAGSGATITATGVTANAVALTTGTTGNYVASVATTAPLSGGAAGREGAALTLSIANAAADGSTKGAASFTAADFNDSSGNISIDYANGQEATTSVDGLLSASKFQKFDTNYPSQWFGAGRTGGANTTGRRTMWWHLQTSNGTTLGGGGGGTLSTAGTVASSTVITREASIKHTSAASTDSDAGVSLSNFANSDMNPFLCVRLRTDTSIATMRFWFSIDSGGTPLGIDAPTTSAGCSGTPFVGIAYTNGVNGGNFVCASCDSTNKTGTDIGVTVATSTVYDLCLDWSALGSLTCWVNGTSVTKTTNLPATGVNNMSWRAQLRTRENVAKNLYVVRATAELN